MKSITWLRKFVVRDNKGYPIASLAFYGPDDKKASKAVLSIFASKGAEPQLHKWFGESPEVDLRYDTKLQNAWIEIIRQAGVRSLAMMVKFQQRYVKSHRKVLQRQAICLAI